MCINYLDITLFSENNKTFMKNVFKKVDCNSLLDYTSCHYKRWLTNVPFGQCRRIRRNCTKDSDFLTQSNILKKRFEEKRYPTKLIEGAFIRAKQLTQQSCIQPRLKNTDKKEDIFKNAFTTTFNQNHNKIRLILKKYQYILKNDPHLKNYIPKEPTMIFRRPHTLKNSLAPSDIRKKYTKQLI